MDELIKDLRVTNAMQVLTLIQGGAKLGEACAIVGITPQTFRKYLAERPDVTTELITKQKEILQGQFNRITLARNTLISELCEAAEDPEIGTDQRLVLESRLHQLQVELAKELGAHNPQEDAAADFLKGPQFRRGITRVTQTKTEIEYNTNPQADSIDIVEGVARTATEEQILEKIPRSEGSSEFL